MRREFTATEIDTKFEEMVDAAYDSWTVALWILWAARDEGVEVVDFKTMSEVTWAAEKLVRKGIDLANINNRHK